MWASSRTQSFDTYITICFVRSVAASRSNTTRNIERGCFEICTLRVPSVRHYIHFRLLRPKMSAYMMYRETTLGTALTQTLDEFIADGMISKELARKVLSAYDKNMNKALAQRAREKVTFKGEKLITYRYCDNVWTFIMENVELRDSRGTIDLGMIDKVKIVACDGNTPKTS